MKVTTNNVPRDIIEGYELTEKERAEFDYIDWKAIEAGEDSVVFVRYKGELYDLDEFESMWPNRFEGWDGIQPETHFSGLLIKFVNKFEQVIVGRYCT
jgi:hypothetical protein